jgi:glutamate synthase (NADPH/NADH) large chain/glutamate synthase (ferredoxin)
MLAHNGEINTRRGNANWMRAREAELSSDQFWKGDIDLLKPIIQPGGSDSAELDNALEALVMSGRSVLHAMTMLVPPAWRPDKELSPELRAFYEYHRCLNEPWDGPACLVFTDGLTVGACLDRNGLRPSRYKVTSDGIISLGSEVGTIEFEDEIIVEKGRIGPGEMIAVDTVKKKLLRNREIKEELGRTQPYGEWMKKHLLQLAEHAQPNFTPATEPLDVLSLTQRQLTFGF